ncbi:ATP-binding cassette domain-containing protein [Paenibacillus sp. BR2-3]|uniref:ATP-binding cassette domain-containing protein n=1 Tax=Paenibacillus sp. BR2-3 TaxID=3048494 RepID=UPI0039773958
MKAITEERPIIELERVAKIYSGTAVLQEVSMVIEKGKATALVGRNGSGKSTLLSILGGLDSGV